MIVDRLEPEILEDFVCTYLRCLLQQVRTLAGNICAEQIMQARLHTEVVCLIRVLMGPMRLGNLSLDMSSLA